MSRLSVSPYQMVNLLTGLAIILVFIYSGIFDSGNGYYPVECAHISIYGDDCTTCGLSRSFSEMVRGNFESAAGYNRNGPLIFGFFAFQLIMRIIAGLILLRTDMIRIRFSGKDERYSRGYANTRKTDPANRKEKILIVSDSVLSAILFIFCFRNLLIFWH